MQTTLTCTNSVMDHIVVDLDVVGTKHSDCRAEAVVEGTALYIGWCGVLKDVTNVQEGQGESRVVEVRPSLLASQLELHISKVTRTCCGVYIDLEFLK